MANMLRKKNETLKLAHPSLPGQCLKPPLGQTGEYETCVFATEHNIPSTTYGSGHYPDSQTEVGSLLGLESYVKCDKLSLPKVAGVLEQYIVIH